MAGHFAAHREVALIFPYVFNFDQIHPPAFGYERPFAIRVRGLPMYTSAECRAYAEEKLAQADTTG
jgi:hypothetical protein